MTNTVNIPGADGAVMVPVVKENGELMAYVLYPDLTGMVQGFSSWTTIPRQYQYHSTTIPLQEDTDRDTAMQKRERLYRNIFFSHKESPRWTGQPFINHLKTSIMSTESQKKVRAERIKNDPAFERTRENMAEFTRAGKAAKLTRTVFREVLINVTDKATQGRLVKVFSRIIATDPVNARGERTVNNGDLLQVQGFNFNQRAGLSETLYVRCPVAIDRATGQVTVTVPAFVPRIMVQAARGTTHFRIVAAAAAIDFNTETFEQDQQVSPELPWQHIPVSGFGLTLNLPANSPHAIAVVVGIEFYQRVNTRMYALKSGEFNAASVVKVDVLS